MTNRQPPVRDTAPIAARYRLRYRKVGRMRFSSARDFQRALERAIRRAGVPMAFSAGFSPHPRISYTNTVATGVASEAEYFELGLTRRVDPLDLRRVLAEGLPAGFDIVEVVEASTSDFADRLQASVWEIALPGIPAETSRRSVEQFEALDSVAVQRLTKRGQTQVDVRAAVVSIEIRTESETAAPDAPYAILLVVVLHVTPSVRPVDVLTALKDAAGLPQPQAPRICRLAQGPLGPDGRDIGDPFDRDRQEASRA